MTSTASSGRKSPNWTYPGNTNELIVTLNSDDPAYFGGYVNENYQAMQDHMGLDDATLARIARNSFNASFLESRRREELKAELDAYLAANTVVEQ